MWGGLLGLLVPISAWLCSGTLCPWFRRGSANLTLTFASQGVQIMDPQANVATALTPSRVSVVERRLAGRFKDLAARSQIWIDFGISTPLSLGRFRGTVPIFSSDRREHFHASCQDHFEVCIMLFSSTNRLESTTSRSCSLSETHQRSYL
jgi:hypothetical protein